MKVVVVGLGRMGRGLSLNLVKKGHQVTVIDINPEAIQALGPDFPGTKIVGFGFDRDVLNRAKLNQVDAVVSCTASDEANVVVARTAKNVYRVPRVVARLYDAAKADIYRRIGIQTISTTRWGIDRATELLTFQQFDSVYDMGSVNLVRIEVPSPLVGHTVRELTVLGEILVVCISRNSKSIIPTMGSMLEAEDVLYISVAASASGRLKSMLGLV